MLARWLLALAFVGISGDHGQPAPDLVQSARQTQAATRDRLQVLGDAFTCPEARFVSYRRSDFEPEIVDHWYVASQMWADVALVRLLDQQNEGDAADRCYIEKAHLFLDRQWDYAGRGGYFPRSNPTGTRVEGEVRFGDDNALTGLVLLDLLQITADPQRRQQYLHSARRQAAFLVQADLWDDTFGGGFWWNTSRGSTIEGKPAQTNALAALFFGRLYLVTEDEAYRTWMLRTLLWLDTILYDPSAQLYRWSVSYQDLARRTGAVISSRHLNYDQSIGIQAQLLAAKIDGDANRIVRAAAVGDAIQSAFWIPERGYSLAARGAQVYTSYGAWTSVGHLELFDATAEQRWLDMAVANLDVLTRQLGEPDGGFGTQVFRCVGELAQYCRPDQPEWVVDRIRDGAAHAWVQRLQVELARRSADREREALE